MASGTAICLLSPVELVKIRSQMAIDGKRGPVSVIRELYQNGGRDSRTYQLFWSLYFDRTVRNNSWKAFSAKMDYSEDSQHSLHEIHLVTVFILCLIQSFSGPEFKISLILSGQFYLLAVLRHSGPESWSAISRPTKWVLFVDSWSRQLDDIGGYGNSPISFIIAGAFAGMFTWAVANPIGTINS